MCVVRINVSFAFNLNSCVQHQKSLLCCAPQLYPASWLQNEKLMIVTKF